MTTSTECIQTQLVQREKQRRGLWVILHDAWMTFEQWGERARQRKVLLELDDRLLKDIGISPEDAQREGMKPFWKD